MSRRSVRPKWQRRQRPMSAYQVREGIRSGRFRFLAAQGGVSKEVEQGLEEKKKDETAGGDLNIRVSDGTKVGEVIGGG